MGWIKMAFGIISVKCLSLQLSIGRPLVMHHHQTFASCL